MIDHGIQLVLDNRILVNFVNVMVMLNDAVLIQFDMHKQIIRRAAFVKIVNTIQWVQDVNFVKIFSIRTVLCQLQIHMFVNVSSHKKDNRTIMLLNVFSLQL